MDVFVEDHFHLSSDLLQPTNSARVCLAVTVAVLCVLPSVIVWLNVSRKNFSVTLLIFGLDGLVLFSYGFY